MKRILSVLAVALVAAFSSVNIFADEIQDQLINEIVSDLNKGFTDIRTISEGVMTSANAVRDGSNIIITVNMSDMIDFSVLTDDIKKQFIDAIRQTFVEGISGGLTPEAKELLQKSVTSIKFYIVDTQNVTITTTFYTKDL